MEPRSRASPEQFSVLIDFMERHGDLSRPQPGLQGRIKSDQLWQNLTNMLNSLGGGVQKSLDKWKKVWADWKTKSKKKSLRIRQQASATGGASSGLTALEKRVVAIIRMSAVIGQAGIREQGFNRTSSEPNDCDAASAIEIPLPLESDNILHIVSEGHIENTAVESPPVTTCVPTTSQPQYVTIRTSASPPPPPTLETLPRSPQLPRNNQTQASPLSTSTTPRRILSRARRNRGLTPFERAADQFAAIEQRRIQHEEARDKRLHEREMERLRLEAERIVVTREQNSLLHQLSQQLIDVISNKHQPVDCSPSTDSI